MRLSIITVCYNSAATIKTTLESIYEQDFKDFEHIIIDGKSKDGTLSIIASTEFAKRSIISEPDKGIYDAMNKGLDLAKGDFVYFLNSGDTFSTPTTLSEIFNSLPPETDFIYGDTKMMNALGEDLGLRRLRPPQHLKASDFLMGMLVCHQAMMVKKSIAPKYKLQYRISADFDWSIRCLKNAKHIHNTQHIIANYLVGGTSRQNTWKSLMERLQIMKEHFGLFPTLLSHIKIVFRFAFHAFTRSWKKMN
jgi:glycosyltransferase involved in cell wall biosynthesis